MVVEAVLEHEFYNKHAAQRGNLRDRLRPPSCVPKHVRRVPRLGNKQHASPTFEWDPFSTTPDDRPSTPFQESDEGARRKEIDSLRQLLQGGEETLDKVLAREEEHRREKELKERVRAQRDKRKRQRAEEVTFLRSVAIRDAQATCRDSPQARGSDGSTTEAHRSAKAAASSKDWHNTTHPEQRASAVKKGSGERDGGDFGWDSLAAREAMSAGVGAESVATDSIRGLGDVSSSLAAKADLHAQEAVKRALQRLDQVPSLDPTPCSPLLPLSSFPPPYTRTVSSIHVGGAATPMLILHLVPGDHSTDFLITRSCEPSRLPARCSSFRSNFLPEYLRADIAFMLKYT
jgi:hypothetical protein